MMYRIINNKIKYSPLYIHEFSFSNGRKKSKKETVLSNSPDDLSIADKLKYYRHKENMSQADVADYIEISRVTYGAYERGVNYYPIKVMLRLADRYSVDLDVLLDDYHRFIYNQQGNQIKTIRSELGNIKQYDLANILDVPVYMVKRWESDRMRISRENYNRLMDYYTECLDDVEDVEMVAVNN